MPQLYSLEASIADFFQNHSTVTRERCDSIAKALLGDPVIPVPIQGAWSYTVTAGPVPVKIMQFRAQSSSLDMGKLKLACQNHPEFVPSIEYHGDTGGARPFSVYTFTKVPGVPYVLTRSNKTPCELRLNTVRDFSRFFAQSWNSPQSLSDGELADLEIQLQQKLDVLLASLPARFATTLSRLRGQYLSRLFQEKGYPMVLTHGDPCALNVLVDPESLHITGLIDWAEAKLAPFGLALYGIFNVIGFMDSNGWHYYANYQDMVAQFWTTLEHEIGTLSDTKRNLIRAACTIGIFLEHGFEWNGQDKTTFAEEGGDAMGFLDGWLGAGSDGNDLLLLSKPVHSGRAFTVTFPETHRRFKWSSRYIIKSHLFHNLYPGHPVIA